jgi:hypothetical protein
MVIPKEKRPVLQGTVGGLIAANGGNIASTGKAVFQLGFKDIQVDHEFWVADIQNDVILGYDFLSKYCQVDYMNNRVVCCHQDIQGTRGSSKKVCRHMVLRNKVAITARSEQLVTCEISGTAGRLQQAGPQAGYISPGTSLLEKSGFLVAKGVVDMSRDTTLIRLLNLSEEPNILRKKHNDDMAGAFSCNNRKECSRRGDSSN